MMRMTYFCYLLAAAWQDVRERKLSLRLCLLFAAAGIVENVLWPEVSWADAAAALVPGTAMLLITRCSRGAVGCGDGWFLLSSSVYLGFWGTVALLFYGLLFCSAFCLGIVAWGTAAGVRVGKMRLPFLPFLLPAWVMIGLLR